MKGSHVVMPALATLSLEALAEMSGVDTDTLRSYARLGLISRPRRTSNGLQLYPADEAERVTFIRRSLELGFPVPSIREMLGLGRRKSLSCDDVYAIAERQLRDIRRRLADRKGMEDALSPLVESCPRVGSLGNCTIVNTLSRPSPLPDGI
jgi:MerR family mercuric resistance operon transcriptional regulator